MATSDRRKKLQKYTVVVTCVVVKRIRGHAARVLILKRSLKEAEGPGLWTIPGGKVRTVDWGRPQRVNTHKIWLDVLRRAIRREVKEEAGLNLERFIFMWRRDKIFKRQDGTPTIVLVFKASYAQKARVRIGKEQTGYCWVTKRELHHYKFIGNVKDDVIAALKM